MPPPYSKKRAAAEYEAAHWGEKGTRGEERLRVATPGIGSLVLLGDLIEITYRTRKRGDGIEAADYEHAFARPYPRLAYNSAGLLVIAGGKYTISTRGIIG